MTVGLRKISPKRDRRKLQRQPAGLPDAALDRLGQPAQALVTVVQLTPGVADPDRRLPQILVGVTLALVKGVADEGGEAGVAVVGEFAGIGRWHADSIAAQSAGVQRILQASLSDVPERWMSTSHRYSSADLAAMPSTEGVRYEIIDGELHVSTMPHWRHQYACNQIGQALGYWSRQAGGLTLQAPGLIFSPDNDVAPDVVWVSRERLAAAGDAAGHLRAAHGDCRRGHLTGPPQRAARPRSQAGALFASARSGVLADRLAQTDGRSVSPQWRQPGASRRAQR